jgi:predicted ATP-dependent protease
MIIERTAAKKSLAVTLALALFASTPMSAWSQTQSAAVGAVPGGIGVLGAIGTYTPNMSAVMAPVALPNLSLTAPTIVPSVAPAVSAMASVVPATMQAVQPAAIQPMAVEAHPVIGLINALQAKGIVLPETLSTRQDAAQLIVAAQAMPEGTAKQNMIAMAAAINAANNTGSSAQMGKIFDAAMARAEAPEAAVEGGWRSVVSRLLPAPLAKMVAKKAPEAAPAAQPANPEDYAVKIADLHYAPSTKQIPANTTEIPASDKQVVGQDGALKAIKFGLQMPGRHYNLFVAGPEGSGRETALRHMLPEIAAKMPTPGDRVAVTNFADKENPLVLDLATGRGPAFAKGVRKFVSTLKAILPEALESGEIGKVKQQVIGQIQEAAAEREAAFQAEVKTIELAGGVFTVEFFAQPSGEGRMMIGLKLMRNGQAVDPANVDKDIAAGSYTRAQFDAASKERDQKFPAVMDKFKAMMDENNKEMEAAQEQIAKIEKQAVASIISQAAQPLMAAVMPETKVSPEMAALQEKIEAWSADFEKRVSAVNVDGFGVAFIQNGNRVQVAYTHGGESLSSDKVAELMKTGLTPARFAEIKTALTAAVEPLFAEFKAKNQEFGTAQQALAKSQPKTVPTPEMLKAVSYVKMLVQFSVVNHQIFMGKIGAPSGEDGEEGIKDAPGQKPMDAQDFFEASVISSNGGKTGAPVVWVKNPTLDKVFGKADDNKRTMLIPGVGLVKGGAPGGATLIGGAIQQAEGGFLVMDFMDVLRAPGLYQALMAAAKTGEASMIEGGLQSLMNGKNEAYHVPSKVKIVLIGSPSLRMMVERQDEDFAANFQASADFESTLKVSEQSVAGYVQFFKKAVESLAAELKQDATNLTQDAMSALVEHGARLAESNKKLTAQFGALYSVVREATYWAHEAGRKEIRREDVDTALQTRQDRDEVYRQHMLQTYKDNIFVVETAGKKVGQINGLAVMGSFGVPMRITVVPSAAAGAGGIISVDRQAGPSQTGSSFNKALGVVEGFLQNLFATKRPFPARLSISYEQNYGGIDGDSATSTEMYSILSALSGVAIGQNFAVTGSADQFGNVQAIGGVNHKIEGFYELCKARGLTGEQGIVIPQANVGDLQLSPEVVQDVKDGKFHIYAVSHVSQGLEILTGVAYSEILAKARANLAAMGKPEAKTKH